tara:strand:+ start:629 stop:769 length:141 start_codon:yes stop_codon:yes gene_type:complete
MHAPFVYGGAVMERREAEIAKSIVASCGECVLYFKIFTEKNKIKFQ